MRNIWIVLATTFALLFAAAASAQVSYSNRPPDDRGGRGQVVSCGSPQYQLLRCPVPRHWRGARLVRQTSDSACVEGRTWGFERGSVWVNKGCAGEFAAAGGGGGGFRPGPDWNREFVVSCGSPQYQRYFCKVDVGARGHVRLQHQYSDAACVKGRTWGWNRAGIWVDKGCGAHFLVTRRR